VFDSANKHADATPMQSSASAGDRPKPRRSRAQSLTHLDKRGRLAKRIAELKAIYVAALGGSEGLSPIKRLRVDEAAQLKALAEQVRGEYLRTGAGVVVDDIVRLERKASAAERGLGIIETPVAQSESPLVAHFSRPPSHEGRG
jgi:hypothetical protein